MLRKVFICCFAILFSTAGVVGSVDTRADNKADYTYHEPIVIEGNSDFTSENGVVSGTGTKEDPYVISGWFINETLTSGISIINTTKHFIIRDVMIKPEELYFYPVYGIVLTNTSYGSIERSTIESSYYGIGVMDSDNVTINENDLRSNYASAIRMQNTNDSTIMKNSILGSYYAIWLERSNNNILLNNSINFEDTLGYEKFSIIILYSVNNSLMSNKANANGIAIGGDEVSHYNSHEITEDNTVYNKTIYYIKDQKNETLSENAGQVIIVNSTNVLVTAQNISGVANGIAVAFSSNINITDCSFSFNWDGIDLEWTTNSTILNCSFVENEDGIDLFNSDNNTIDNNYFSGNRVGINIKDSAYNHVTNNILTLNSAGIQLDPGFNNRIESNIITVSTYSGIYMTQSANNTVINNQISHNGFAMSMYYSVNTTFTGNTLIENSISHGGSVVEHWNTHTFDDTNSIDGNAILYFTNLDGIEITPYAGQIILSNCKNLKVQGFTKEQGSLKITVGYSSGIIITNNSAGEGSLSDIELIDSNNCEIINNENFAISLSSSNENLISGNDFPETRETGLSLHESSLNTISDNNFVSMENKGFHLKKSNKNKIENNIFKDITRMALDVDTSGDNTISNNTFDNADGGISFTASDQNSFKNNYMTKSNILSLFRSDKNEFVNNEFIENHYGLVLRQSGENTISDNEIFDNGFVGIEITRNSDRNIVSLNNISGNNYGIQIHTSDNNTVSDNYIYSNSNSGLELHYCTWNIIKENTISLSKNGIYIKYRTNVRDNDRRPNPSNNLIYNNNFFFNENQVNYQDIDSNNTNSWNTDYPAGGNYWSDYEGVDEFSGPNQDLAGADGIGDTPYEIDDGVVDQYPLMGSVGGISVSPPEKLFDPDDDFHGVDDGRDDRVVQREVWYVINAVFLFILVLIFLLVWRRKKKEMENQAPLKPLTESGITK